MELKLTINDDDLLQNYKKHVAKFLDSSEFSELIFEIIYKKLFWFKKIFFKSKALNNLFLDLEKIRKDILIIYKNSFYKSIEIQKKLTIELQIIQNKEIFSSYELIKSEYPELIKIIEEKIKDIYINQNNLETNNVYIKVIEGNESQDNFKCFIARPYNIDEAEDWNNIVFDTLKQKNIEVLDAERKVDTINILTKIENLIDESNFAIIDLTMYENNTSNLNAIFEIGIVKGKRKEIIFTHRIKDFKENKLSDVKFNEGILYKNYEDLKKQLIKHLDNVINKINISTK